MPLCYNNFVPVYINQVEVCHIELILFYPPCAGSVDPRMPFSPKASSSSSYQSLPLAPYSSNSIDIDTCSDDVCHSTDESLAQVDRGRRMVSRRLLRTIQQSSLRDNPPSVSGETTSRIPSHQLSLRNGVMPHATLCSTLSGKSFLARIHRPH
ncbi:unnamed protein product [Protopolystoma xenopodis]|uniref:Uncharacterized protein n=1 Tax=Protopolystoma xenopodis TaxID=117903 RepID=A0A448XEJ1_9PLAT|nr:unnamed protein product [Protopolystoma xenopodis]